MKSEMTYCTVRSLTFAHTHLNTNEIIHKQPRLYSVTNGTILCKDIFIIYICFYLHCAIVAKAEEHWRVLRLNINVIRWPEDHISTYMRYVPFFGQLMQDWCWTCTVLTAVVYSVVSVWICAPAFHLLCHSTWPMPNGVLLNICYGVLDVTRKA